MGEPDTRDPYAPTVDDVPPGEPDLSREENGAFAVEVALRLASAGRPDFMTTREVAVIAVHALIALGWQPPGGA